MNPTVATLLMEASIQAYYAYDDHAPARCRPAGVCPPPGYDLVDCWTGVDTVFSVYDRLECFGVVFRSKQAPYTYVFAFRGTYSIFDIIEDAAFWETSPFTPLRGAAPRPSAHVASGFWSIYTTARGST